MYGKAKMQHEQHCQGRPGVCLGVTVHAWGEEEDCYGYAEDYRG